MFFHVLLLIFGIKFENNMAFDVRAQENELLNATMRAMKLAVGSCSEGSQDKIIKKKGLQCPFIMPFFYINGIHANHQYNPIGRVAAYSKFRMFFL